VEKTPSIEDSSRSLQLYSQNSLTQVTLQHAQVLFFSVPKPTNWAFLGFLLHLLNEFLGFFVPLSTFTFF